MPAQYIFKKKFFCCIFIFYLMDIIKVQQQVNQMKQVRQKPLKNAIIQQFKQKCKLIMKQDAKSYLLNAIKDKSFNLDLNLCNLQDIPMVEILLSLQINRVFIFLQQQQKKSPNKNQSNNIQIRHIYQMPKFKDLMRVISQSLHKNQHIKILKIQKIPLSQKAIKQLYQGIKNSKSLRQISIVQCKLKQSHLQTIKTALAQNQSLITIDFSHNNLCDVGGMLGNILAEHSRRRSEMIWLFNLRGQTPLQDISNTGICEINLEHNLINNKTVFELVVFLKNDTWTKCINLRNNLIHAEGIRQLALMLKNNSSLISMDLRDNEGLSKEYSKYIYKKLLLNMERYKQHRLTIQKNKQLIKEENQNNANQDSLYNKNHSETLKHKSMKDSNILPSKYQSKEQFEDDKEKKKINLTVDHKSHLNQFKMKNNARQQCSKCKEKTFEMLKLQKQNLDLSLQLRKVKNALLTKNIDISSIMPNNSQNSVAQWLSNKTHQNDDEIIQRMEQIMCELTRIMESMEEQQQTKQNISNPLQNLNSFSNTIQLYNQNSQLRQLQEQIMQQQNNDIFQDEQIQQNKIQGSLQ